jgi:hypothetical protein
MQGAAAALRFHWFLPTNGDGRDIVGGGHGVATGAAGPVRHVQEGLASSESEGQRRIRDLHHGGYRSDLTVAPEPLGRRGGAGTEFILSGYRS